MMYSTILAATAATLALAVPPATAFVASRFDMQNAAEAFAEHGVYRAAAYKCDGVATNPAADAKIDELWWSLKASAAPEAYALIASAEAGADSAVEQMLDRIPYNDPGFCAGLVAASNGWLVEIGR